jgi:hypothetical protein
MTNYTMELISSLRITGGANKPPSLRVMSIDLAIRAAPRHDRPREGFAT